eukprot:9320740-Pyramimonas_sp.AAC.1
MEVSASEAPCAICRGVGLITAGFHRALANHTCRGTCYRRAYATGGRDRQQRRDTCYISTTFGASERYVVQAYGEGY